MKRALITGITGQDGSFLAEFLLSKGYEVWGIVRRTSTVTTSRIAHLLDRVNLVHGDMTDGLSLLRAVRLSQPDEVYNLAAQSQVGVSFAMPEYTSDVVGRGAVRLLEVLRSERPEARYYQASTSELFGKVACSPQNERTPFHPRSPYASAKAEAFHATVNHREAYGMFAVNGILYNHESERRAEDFVTRKITRAATRISLGLQHRLELGNLAAKRDWGYAGEYVVGMWLMLQASSPDDYVLATGETNSVEDFVRETFAMLDLDWTKYVDHKPSLDRPSEVDLLLGDASKARRDLGWAPLILMPQLIRIMVDHDLALAGKEART